MQEYNFSQFFSRHIWKIALSLASIVLLCISLDRYLSSKTFEKKHDFLTIKTLFEKVGPKEPLSKESLDTAEAILKRHPELHATYDTALAINYAAAGNNEKTHLLTADILKRLEKQMPAPYLAYTKISLLLLEENFSQAYLETEALEASLKETAVFDTLRAFNLVRLTVLAKKLGNAEIATRSLATLESLKSYPTLAPLFEEGTFTLKQYTQVNSKK